MKRRRISARGFLLLAAAGLAGSAFAIDAPPHGPLKTFALHGRPDSADFSPDEQSVVTQVTRETKTDDPNIKNRSQAVQLWDFKADRMIAEFRLPDDQISFRRVAAGGVEGGEIVRFSPDGRTVIAVMRHSMYVLDAGDLREIREIPLSAPAGKPAYTQIRAMELSPTNSLAAVFWSTSLINGRIDLYDLSTGVIAQSQDTPQGWILTKDMAWSADGKRLFIPIANEAPCSSPGSLPDVFVLDVATRNITPKLRTGLLPGSVARIGDDRLATADKNCIGVFKNHNPALEVFDMKNGKRIKAISVTPSGARDWVSASADGTRFAAYTGRTEARFDWGDMLPFEHTIDETFTVWNSADYSEIARSQNIPGLRASGLRMSATGRYAVSAGKASYVYELPAK